MKIQLVKLFIDTQKKWSFIVFWIMRWTRNVEDNLNIKYNLNGLLRKSLVTSGELMLETVLC